MLKRLGYIRHIYIYTELLPPPTLKRLYITRHYSIESTRRTKTDDEVFTSNSSPNVLKILVTTIYNTNKYDNNAIQYLAPKV